jgi:hypothetical protein
VSPRSLGGNPGPDPTLSQVMEERFGVLPKSDDFGFTGAEKSVTLTTNFLTWNLEYGNVGPPPKFAPKHGGQNQVFPCYTTDNSW